MGSLILVRHGQASAGTDDYDRLSPLGWQQAEWLGHWMQSSGTSIDRVLRGSLRRHRETADGIAKVLALPQIDEDPRLNELNYDALLSEYVAATGTPVPEERLAFLEHFPKMFVGWSQDRFEGIAEPFAYFTGRVAAGIEDALVQDKTTLVVTSGGVIGVTLGAAMGLSPAQTAELLLDIHNASIHRMNWEGGRLRVSMFNAVPHLEHRERSHARTYI
jgi:broad specificity phosphatase PhoE